MCLVVKVVSCVFALNVLLLHSFSCRVCNHGECCSQWENRGLNRDSLCNISYLRVAGFDFWCWATEGSSTYPWQSEAWKGLGLGFLWENGSPIKEQLGLYLQIWGTQLTGQKVDGVWGLDSAFYWWLFVQGYVCIAAELRVRSKLCRSQVLHENVMKLCTSWIYCMFYVCTNLQLKMLRFNLADLR